MSTVYISQDFKRSFMTCHSNLCHLIVPLSAIALISVSAPAAQAHGPAARGQPFLGAVELSKGTGPLIMLATQSGNFQMPLDSTPNPSGDTIYFIANARAGAKTGAGASAKMGNDKGVFGASARGGKASSLFTGAPFVSPSGIASSLDGQSVFIADVEAGQIFALSVTGKGAPAAVRGTSGTFPQNLDVVREHNQETIYYTGKDAGGQPAVFKIASTGADAPTLVFKGEPLVTPDGIAVAPDGVIYLADRAAGKTKGQGKVFRIKDGAITPLVDTVRTDNPAGIALTKDGLTLLVSSYQADGKHDQVLVVNTATGASTVVTDVVGKNKDAGGVHRAQAVNIFAWADIIAGGHGRVYRVQP